MKGSLTWIELSKKNFIHNIKTIRQIIGPEVLMAACVKANAYGHGLVEAAEILSRNGADWLCVDTVDEALALRRHHINCQILIMGFIGHNEAASVVGHGFRFFIYDINLAEEFSRQAKKQNKAANVHIKIDTGMSRQGIRWDEAEIFIKKISRLPMIKIEGLATHFATVGEPRKEAYYLLQKKRFNEVVDLSKRIIGNDLIIHGANSSALLADKKSHCKLVRPGIIVYGYYPNTELKNICIKKRTKFLPVLSLYTKIIQVKNIKKNELISYGGTYQAKSNMKIAVLPIGYYDGISRGLSNKGFVLVKGRRAAIVGRVCMNIMMVNITNIKGVKEGDNAIIIGKSGKNEISADDIAKFSNTINYEVITRLRESAKRMVID